MVKVWCLIIGYLFGLIQTAYLYGRIHGIDIRTVGSGNAGTTNTLRVLGPKAGLIVLIGDMLKTVVAIIVVKLVFGNMYPELEYLLMLYTAFGAVLGHNYPFYMGFKGGKGIAATSGMIISFNPWFILVGVFSFFGPFLITKYVSLGSLSLNLFFFIQMIVWGQCGLFPIDISQPVLIEMYIVTFLICAMAFWRHRGNIKKLLDGTERKTYVFHKPEGHDNAE